jgi:hypothetical protein
MRVYVLRIEIHAERVDIHLCPSRVSEILRGEFVDGAGVQHRTDEKPMVLVAPATLKRAGMETRMVAEGTDPYGTTNPDSSLIKLLRDHQ